MRSASRLSARFSAILAASLLLFLALDSYANYAFFTSRFPGANDFYARWQPLHTWLLQGRDPYSDEATRDTQIGMSGQPTNPNDSNFYYPLYSVLFFGPAALITSYAWASAVWIAILQASLLALAVLSVAWSDWRPSPALLLLTLVFGILWYHSVRTFVLGQFAAVEALLLIGAVLAARSTHDFWAGVLLALATTKPQMAVLVIVGLLLWSVSMKRWSLVAWFLIGMAVLVGGSSLFLPAWLPEWLGQVLGYADTTAVSAPMAILIATVFPGSGHWLQYVLDGAVIAYMLWGWWQARADTGRRLDWAVALTLVVTNLVAVVTATTNYVMMLPALFLLFSLAQREWGRRGSVVIILVEIILFFGLWALFLTTVNGRGEQPLMYLPLPFLLLVALAIGRRAWINRSHVAPAS